MIFSLKAGLAFHVRGDSVPPKKRQNQTRPLVEDNQAIPRMIASVSESRTSSAARRYFSVASAGATARTGLERRLTGSGGGNVAAKDGALAPVWMRRSCGERPRLS